MSAVGWVQTLAFGSVLAPPLRQPRIDDEGDEVTDLFKLSAADTFLRSGLHKTPDRFDSVRVIFWREADQVLG